MPTFAAPPCVSRVPLKFFFWRADPTATTLPSPPSSSPSSSPVEVKRISLDGGKSAYDDLQRILSAWTVGHAFELTYLDHEGDAVLIEGSADWEECLRLWMGARTDSRDNTPLHLQVALGEEVAVEGEKEKPEVSSIPSVPSRRRKKKAKKAKSIRVRFANHSDHDIKIFWIPKGKRSERVMYGLIGAGKAFSVRTYPGHTWMYEKVEMAEGEEPHVVPLPSRGTLSTYAAALLQESQRSTLERVFFLVEIRADSTHSSHLVEKTPGTSSSRTPTPRSEPEEPKPQGSRGCLLSIIERKYGEGFLKHMKGGESGGWFSVKRASDEAAMELDVSLSLLLTFLDKEVLECIARKEHAAADGYLADAIGIFPDAAHLYYNKACMQAVLTEEVPITLLSTWYAKQENTAQDCVALMTNDVHLETIISNPLFILFCEGLLEEKGSTVGTEVEALHDVEEAAVVDEMQAESLGQTEEVQVEEEEVRGSAKDDLFLAYSQGDAVRVLREVCEERGCL